MWHDLSQPLEESMPYSQKFDELGTPPRIERVLTHEDDGAAVSSYSMLTHVGTHVDAPCHFDEGGETIDEVSLDRVTGPGVCLDVSQDEVTEISLETVRSAPGEVHEGDVVLLYTGWYHKYGTEAYDPHPWLADEVAEWLIDRGVSMVALDTITPDLPGPMRPNGWEKFPIHRKLLGNGVLIAEHLTGLAPLTGERLEVVAAPLKLRDGDGAQARIIAKPT